MSISTATAAIEFHIMCIKSTDVSDAVFPFFHSSRWNTSHHGFKKLSVEENGIWNFHPSSTTFISLCDRHSEPHLHHYRDGNICPAYFPRLFGRSKKVTKEPYKVSCAIYTKIYGC